MTTTPAPRSTANPRRTTLARLADAASLQRPATRPDAGTLPAATANPRRTLLATTPAVTGPAYGAQLPGQTANPVRTILMTAPAPARFRPGRPSRPSPPPSSTGRPAPLRPVPPGPLRAARGHGALAWGVRLQQRQQ